MILSAETTVAMLGPVVMRLVSVVRRGRRVSMVRIAGARGAHRRGRVTSREGEGRVTMVRRRRGVRRSMMRRMRAPVSTVSMVRAMMRTMRAMRRWGMSKYAIIESVGRVSHLLTNSVQNTLHAITLLDLLHGRGGWGRILLAQLLSNRCLPLLHQFLKLKNLLVQSIQFHKLNLKFLLGILEIAVGILPDGG